MATVTIAGEDFTTYASLADANTYALGASHAAAFRAASDDDKGRHLVTATRTLDRQPGWKPEWDTFAERENEQPIIDASIELAIALASGSNFQTSNTTAGNIESLTAGSVSISYRRLPAGGYPTRFPTIVDELLRPYMGSDGSGGFASKATGTDAETIFPVDLGVTRGI